MYVAKLLEHLDKVERRNVAGIYAYDNFIGGVTFSKY